MQQEFADKDVKFYYVYKTLAHPEGGEEGYVNPFELKERLAHISRAKTKYGTKIPWLSDSMDNSLVRNFSAGNFSGLLVDAKGKVVSFQRQLSLNQLRTELESLVGEVPSKGLSPVRQKAAKEKKYPSGVITRPKLPSSLHAMKVETKESKVPFYAKLRAEVEPAVLDGGKGKMYLGFRLDPIHAVHWNNLAQPLTFELTGAGGVVVEPAKGAAPKLEVEADIDPREFLVEIDKWDGKKPITLSVTYYPCSDDEGWCKKVTQEYAIHLQTDRYAGRIRREGSGFGQRRGRGERGRGERPRRGAGGGGDRPRRGGEGGQPRGRERLTAMVTAADADKNGTLNYAEYQKVPGVGTPEASKADFERFDSNSDKELSSEEFRSLFRAVPGVRRP